MTGLPSWQMIEIRNLKVYYEAMGERHTALENVSLKLPAGRTCAVIGPSGCGKSTLLKVLAGIIKVYDGTVHFDGQPIVPVTQRIGFLPQNYGLLPWKNVYDNISLSARIKNKGMVDSKELQLYIRQLGLAGMEDRYPGELSGGQQQRVALARSFLLKPDLLLMDEPFSALDAITREEIQNVFLQIWRKDSVSTVLVTHNVEEALYLGQQIVVLAGIPGRISQVLENPLFGIEDVRNDQEFFQFCLELRTLIKEDWSK